MTGAVASKAVPSPRSGWRRYGPAWSARPVRRAFAGTLIARTAQTMMPLTLLLVFRQRTGSFATAGIAVAVFGLASMAGGPVTARLADRQGPRVLAGAGAVSAACLIVLAITASPVMSWIAVTAAGISVPPLTSALRAAIVAHLEAGRDRTAAFSLDAIATELLFIAGPVLVAAATALGRTSDALFAAGGLVVIGSALIARAAGRGGHRPRRLGRWQHRRRPRLRRQGLARPGTRAAPRLGRLRGRRPPHSAHHDRCRRTPRCSASRCHRSHRPAIPIVIEPPFDLLL